MNPGNNYKKDSLNIVGIIPARMASVRFPGKPLAEILGKPMICHVYWRSKMAKALSEVYIATCDTEIQDHCIKNNMKVVMTKDTHQRASDRAAEAMFVIEELTGQKIDIVLMIQGDEPMVRPEMLYEVTRPLLEDKSIDVVNLMADINSEEERLDANVVKVVVDLNGFAMYFSREPIPSEKKTSNPVKVYKQIAIIPFRRNSLIKFNELPATPLEIIESVDMLRLLEHRIKVKMVKTKYPTYSVDTQQDLKRVEAIMKTDELIMNYKE